MKRSILIGALLIAVSCGEKTVSTRPVPDHILPKDSMALFLGQIHLVDAASRHREVRKQSLQSYAKRGFIEYFDTAHVSRERFLESLSFWGEDFQEMDEIYDLAMERLSTQMAKLKSEEKEASAAAQAERNR
jgi:hypothetical protein